MGGRRGDGGRNHFKNAGFVALLVLFGLIVYAAVNTPSTLKTVPFSQVIQDANNGKIKQITVKGDQELDITPAGQNQPTEKSYKDPSSSIYEQGLKQGKVTIVNKPASDNSGLWYGLLTGVLPVVIIAFILILMFRSAQGAG